MQNEQKKAEQTDLEKIMEAKPTEATITFIIPAYTDKDGKTFERTIKVPTNKAYATYKNLMKWKYKE